MRWCWVVAAVCAVTALGCSSDDVREPTAFCRLLAKHEAQRRHDITDPQTVEALVTALPSDLRYDGALVYYPHGGELRPGADYKEASEAGKRLGAYYDRECGVFDLRNAR